MNTAMEEDYKTEFTEQEKRMAEFMRALAHPARVAIMIKLARANKCFKDEEVPYVPITNAALKKHLLALEYAGLIKGITNINHADFCIDWETFGEFARTFKQIFDEFDFKNAEQDCRARKGRRKPFYQILLPIFSLPAMAPFIDDLASYCITLI